jgi:hypothetical protein
MTILTIKLEAIDDRKFRASVLKMGSEDLYLPFSRLQLLSVLTALNSVENQYQPFDDDDQNWMVENGLLNEKRTEYLPDRVKKIGIIFFDTLFKTASFKKILQDFYNNSKREYQPLHIQIEYNAVSTMNSDIALYPWHLMYDNKHVLFDSTSEGFIAKNGVRFSYLIAYDGTPPPLKKITLKTLNVLLIPSPISSNTDQDIISERIILKSIEEETDRKSIKEETNRIRILKPLKTTLEELQIVMGRCPPSEKPHVIHFDGHGKYGKRCINLSCVKARQKIFPLDNDVCDQCGRPFTENHQGYLQFEDSQGNIDYISSDEFADFIEQHIHPKPVLAVIASCKSAYSRAGKSVFNGVVQRLIQLGVLAVIGFPFRITNNSAEKFIEQFYRKLILGEGSLFEALHLGTNFKDTQHEWYKPVLFMRYDDKNKVHEEGYLFEIQSFNKPPQSYSKISQEIKENKPESDDFNKKQILKRDIVVFVSKSKILSEIAALIYDLFEERGIEPDYIGGIYPKLLNKLNTHIRNINFEQIPDEIKNCSFVTKEQLSDYEKLCSDIKKQIEKQKKEQKKISKLSPPKNCYSHDKFVSQFEPLLTKTGKIEGWWKRLYENSS